MKTLVIVDMQPKFQSSQKEELIENVKKQITVANLNNWPIILLEFGGFGPTDQRILDALSTIEYYKKTKDNDDGSEEVNETIEEFGLPRTVRLCGVNTNCCVYETYRGLADQGYPLEVVKNACNCVYSELTEPHPKKFDRATIV